MIPQGLSAPPAAGPCRGTSIIRNSLPLGPYGRPMPRVLEGWAFHMSEVPLDQLERADLVQVTLT